MDVNDGPDFSSSEEDTVVSVETQPPPQLSDSDSPPPKPAKSADIPPDPAPRPPERGCCHYNGPSLALSREQTIQRWQLPRRPEYGTLAKRTRSFYQDHVLWDPRGKPSVGF